MTLSPKNSAAVAGTAGSRQLAANVLPEKATNKKVFFSIEPVTEGLAVSESGLISWTESVPAGTYTTSCITEDGSFADSNTLTLSEPEG
ncbi:phage tail protein [Enterococcus avium]|uniref:Phage tail protein n=1 Tax=Enterococcus avium TaxID=33945 RepID=A0A8B5VY22_ENTAV|nr:phage tail protein [Enterococcus avium]DAI97924.1 MAG TPA: hypothetical protein [Caudoviricetes sp.]